MTNTPAVGPVLEPWPDVRRIAVLRGGGLGDLLFAVPAIQSLKAAYPDAELVLLGTRMHAELFADRPSPIHQVLQLPPARGVHEPKGKPFDEAEQREFFDSVGPVDLAVQVHGGGRWSNPFVQRLKPRYTVGSRTEDAVELDRWVPFRYYQHEVVRALEVVGLAGAAPVALEPSVTVREQDLVAAEEHLFGLPRPLVVVHPSATDPRRRWPAEKFAEVIAAVVADGAGVAVIGSPDEQELVDRVTALSRKRVGDASEQVRPMTSLSMSALCGVLASCGVFVGNDSGPRHLARAVGAPHGRDLLDGQRDQRRAAGPLAGPRADLVDHELPGVRGRRDPRGPAALRARRLVRRVGRGGRGPQRDPRATGASPGPCR